MMEHFYKLGEHLNYSENNLIYIKNKTTFSSNILIPKKNYKIVSIPKLFSDFIDKFLDKRVREQWLEYDDLFVSNENYVFIKIHDQRYIENAVEFRLCNVDCYPTFRTELDYDEEFFNEEFFNKFKECPYEIRIVEIAKIKNNRYDSDYYTPPIKYIKTITKEKCVICMENKPNVLYPDCNHLSTCNTCDEYKKIVRCPYCRESASTKYIITN